jgi:hypothetical protein
MLRNRRGGGRICRSIGLLAAAGCRHCLLFASLMTIQEAGKCISLFAAGNSGHNGRITTPQPVWYFKV